MLNKIKILIWKLYNKLNNIFIFFVEKISLRILKYLTVQGLYTLGINAIIYYDIIELNETLEKVFKLSLFIGLSVASVYHYVQFFDLGWLKLKKKFKEAEKAQNENKDLNNIENTEIEESNPDTGIIDLSSELKPVKKEEVFHIADVNCRSFIVDVGGLSDPDNLERAYLFKAILLNLLAWWIKNGG